jgi:hypothetical protein
MVELRFQPRQCESSFMSTLYFVQMRRWRCRAHLGSQGHCSKEAECHDRWFVRLGSQLQLRFALHLKSERCAPTLSPWLLQHHHHHEAKNITGMCVMTAAWLPSVQAWRLRERISGWQQAARRSRSPLPVTEGLAHPCLMWASWGSKSKGKAALWSWFSKLMLTFHPKSMGMSGFWHLPRGQSDRRSSFT